MLVLVINCGSSSIKYQLFDMPDGRVLARGLVERIGEPLSAMHHEANGRRRTTQCAVGGHADGIALILRSLVEGPDGVISDVSMLGAVGHRVVHGSDQFVESCLIDEKVIEAVERFSDLAPLHNPPNLVGIRAAMAALPGVAHVAVFDTAFHQTMPARAYMYALPYELYEKHGIRRYGFHGTSHRYVSMVGSDMLGLPLSETNLITCHLGNGASITAVRDGSSVDTSMGMTPLEGVAMGTRCGDIDPAITFVLADREGLDLDTIRRLYNQKSGLLGLSGVSNDMREVLSAAEGGSARARLALDVYCYRIVKYIGAYKAILTRVDALVFTGGVGENCASIRKAVCRELGCLGMNLDCGANDRHSAAAADISTPQSPTKILVIPTDEEKMIALDTLKLVSRDGA